MYLTQDYAATSVSFRIDPVWLILAVTSALLMARVVRARRVSATAWAQRRGLELTPRLHETVRSYLHRMLWARVIGTLILGLVALLIAAVLGTSLSLLSLPVLGSVLVGEALAPTPRLGATRVASLEHRSLATFAPHRALRTAQFALLMALGLTGYAALAGPVSLNATFLVHLSSLLVGTMVLHIGLRTLTGRALPEATLDRTVDIALRVGSARTLTASGLVFASTGLFIGLGPALSAILNRTAFHIVVQTVGYLVFGAVVWACSLRDVEVEPQ